MLKNEFNNNVVIITGASGSLGRQLAIKLAKQGAWLSLAARDISHLEEVAQKCREFGARTIVVQTDVTKEDQCKRLIDMTVKEYGQLDTLINNAAFSMKKSFNKLADLEIFKYVMEVNYFGSVYCSRFALPYLKARKGRIVAVGSILSKIATPGNTAYCSSKFAMAAFFDALRMELIGSGVSVTVIYPGYLAERMGQEKLEQRSEYGKKIISFLMMRAEKCADIIIKTVAKRKRQAFVPFYWIACVWISLIIPGLFDRIVRLFIINYEKQD
jgi:short-subunit dehydrogenase